MRRLLIPVAVLTGVLSLVGCGNTLTEAQIRAIVQDEMLEIRQEVQGLRSQLITHMTEHQ